MAQLITVREFVDQLFVHNRYIVTPEQKLMFKELVKEYKGIRDMQAMAQNYAAYDNNFLFHMLDCVERRYIDVVVVPRVMRSRNFFESIYNFWMDFEDKLDFIYEKLYEINHDNIEREARNMLIGSPILLRTLTSELFVNKVLHNFDVKVESRGQGKLE